MQEHIDSGNARGAAGDRKSGISPTLIAFIVIAIGAVIFVAQNRAKAEVQFLFFTVTTRVWAGILVALLVGAVLDRLITVWWRRRKEKP